MRLVVLVAYALLVIPAIGLAPAAALLSLAYLLPAYLFELEGGWTDVRSIVAVQDRYLTRP